MDDQYERQPSTSENNPQEAPGTVTDQSTVPPAEVASETPQAAPDQPEQPTQTPDTPPLNGWSSDGGYRFVPPTQPQTPPPAAPQNGVPTGGYYPPQQPTQPTQPVQPPYNGGYSYQYSPQPPRPPKKKGANWVAIVAIIGAIGVIGAVVCLGLAAIGTFSDKPGIGQTDTDDSEPTVNENAPSLEISKWNDDDGGLSTREVVNRNLDSTVVLTIYAQNATFQFGESTLTKAGSASGIVMTKDGYIITNWHCVTNENTGLPFDRVDVTLYNGKEYTDAKIIGADESTDLAVIKINANDLTPAEFGDSSTLAVGDRAIVLGNAAGLSWTATQGIISALARDVYEDTGYAIKCLQTDAAINPGNSGGPMLNNQGLVVGINSSKIASSGYEGLGFSIPINEAKVIIDSLLKYGFVRGRVALGITGKTISSGMYNGFMISSINEGSSLKGTDVQVGDLIVGVDDAEITSFADLRSELAKHKVGDKVLLKLLRSDGRTGRVSSFSVRVTLKEQTG